MRKLKQATAVALALGMLWGTIPLTAFANTTSTNTSATALTQEQAIAVAQKNFQIPDNFKLQNATYQEGRPAVFGATSVWMINYNDNNGEWINFIIDAQNGTLLNLDYSVRSDSSLTSSISQDQLKADAETYLHQFSPDKANQVQLLPLADDIYSGSYGSTSHVFRYARMVNEIPFPADSITIRLNNQGALRGFSYHWTEGLQFPSSTAMVTPDQAKAFFQKALNLQLQYQRKGQMYGMSSQEQLVYGPWSVNGPSGPPYTIGSLPVLDANKGVPIDIDGTSLNDPSPMRFKPLADQPGKPITTQEVTKDVALQLISSYNLGLDGYTLQSSSFQNYVNNSNVYRFDYLKGDPNDYKSQSHLSVSIDAKTGEIRDVMRNSYLSGLATFPPNPALNVDQARQKAIDFVKQALPSKIDKIALDPYGDSQQSAKMGPAYTFRFFTMVNGVPVRDQIISVGVDPNTGMVQQYQSNPEPSSDLKYPSTEGSMSVDAAKEKFVAKYPLQLQYVPLYAKNKSQPDSKPAGVVLAYAPINIGTPMNLDALSGEWVSPWGTPSPQTQKITDIQGHWAEKPLQELANRGIFTVTDSKLNPDQAVTRGDMMKYLVLSVQGPFNMQSSTTFMDVPKTDPNYDYIEQAANRHWVDSTARNFRPSDFMTREEMASVVVSILGYNKLDEKPNTFQKHFVDVSTTNVRTFGDISIVSALGIMNGDGENFDPSQEVTKAQAAVIIQHVIDQIQSKQMYP